MGGLVNRNVGSNVTVKVERVGTSRLVLRIRGKKEYGDSYRSFVPPTNNQRVADPLSSLSLSIHDTYRPRFRSAALWRVSALPTRLSAIGIEVVSLTGDELTS